MLPNPSWACSCGTTPRPCLKPTTPLQAAGMRVEPPPSVATAIGTRPAATATAEPELEFARLSAGGNRIRTSGTAEDAGLVAYLYAHNASRRIPQKGVGSDSRLLAPPCGGSSGLGSGLCVPFPTPGDGQQESRLAPIGRHLVRLLRGGVLRTGCFPRQAAFQGGHEIDDGWRGRDLPGFNGEPLHLGFEQFSQGLLVTISIRRRIETSGPLRDDRLGDRDHLGVELAFGHAELRRPNLLCGTQSEKRHPCAASRGTDG